MVQCRCTEYLLVKSWVSWFNPKAISYSTQLENINFRIPRKCKYHKLLAGNCYISKGDLKSILGFFYYWDASFWPCVSLNLSMYYPYSSQIRSFQLTGPRSAVGNVSGYKCVSDCRSRGREFDPGPVPYFRGDWSWNNFYGHSPPFRWFIQEGLLSVTSESMCTNYWLTACSILPRKKVWLSELTVPQWP